MASSRPSKDRDGEHFRLVAAQARDAIVCATQHGTITYFNPAAERIFGFTAEEVHGRPLTMLMPARFVDAHRSGLERFLETGEARAIGRTLEVAGVRKDGTEFPLALSLAHVKTEGESSFVATLRDLSEEAEAEGARQQREDRYRTLFEGNPHPMWVFDIETLRFLAVNDAATSDYGYTRDEFLAMTLHDVRAHEDITDVVHRVVAEPREARDALSDSRAFRHRKKDGAVIEVLLRSHELTFEGKRARLVLAQDVTERNRAEQALRESERRFRDMLENVTLVAIILDVRGTVTFCNDYGASLIGAPKDEIVGQNWFAQFLTPESRGAIEEGFLSRIGAGQIEPHHQNEILTRKGERRMVAWNNTVLHDPYGKVVGTASIGIDITEELHAKQRLVHDALHDALTGLPNRVLFLDRLNAARTRMNGHGDPTFAVLLMDLDRFKLVNDGLGHAVGDQLLIAASEAIQACVGENDTVARLGGDEFAVLLETSTGTPDVREVALRIHQALASPFPIAGHEVFTTASIGIAIGSGEYARAEDVVRDAHTAMYGAKALGTSHHVVFQGSMRMRAVRLLQVETDLRRALERRELFLNYQPIVLLETGRVIGFEALVRWTHPQRGTVSPLEFIPIAEETGLILPIGRWVLEEACACMQRWAKRRGKPLSITMNVNLSGRQFAQADLTSEIDRVLESTGLDPTRLKLEVTESVLMENADSARLRLEELRSRGIRLCIDDFGTGSSSLAYLVRLPVQTIKVDRAFVRGMSERGENFEIVRAIVTLAKNLDMDIVAEGVETEEQRTRLRALGCEHAQGYLFSRPVDEQAAWAMIEPSS
jgi:diguanylate cyclase (GGDEF)-like protein/PAS domain S-box-containing protein